MEEKVIENNCHDVDYDHCPRQQSATDGGRDQEDTTNSTIDTDGKSPATFTPRRKIGVPEGAISSKDAKLLEALRVARAGSRTLNLTNFDLVHIPREHMDGLQHLQYLFFAENQIMELPPALFFKLPCLKWLDMRGNRLRHIPSEIGQHNSLEVLLLDGNLISHLPFEIAQIPSLRQVTLSKNPWEFPSPQVVAKGWKVVQEFLRDVNAAGLSSQETAEKPDDATHHGRNKDPQQRKHRRANARPSSRTNFSAPYAYNDRNFPHWLGHHADGGSSSSARPGYALPNEQDLQRNHQLDIALAKRRREADRIDKELQKSRDAEFVKQWRGKAAFEQRQFAKDFYGRSKSDRNSGIEHPFGAWKEAATIPDRSTYLEQCLQPLPTSKDEKKRIIALNQRTEGIVNYMKGVFEGDLNTLMSKLSSLENGSSAPSGADAIAESQQLLSEISTLKRKLGDLTIADAGNSDF